MLLASTLPILNSAILNSINLTCSISGVIYFSVNKLLPFTLRSSLELSGWHWVHQRNNPMLDALEFFKFAFLSKDSYFCDIMWACIWLIKSINTTTIINKDVPPK